jgi:hypothetical protein
VRRGSSERWGGQEGLSTPHARSRLKGVPWPEPFFFGMTEPPLGPPIVHDLPVPMLRALYNIRGAHAHVGNSIVDHVLCPIAAIQIRQAAELGQLPQTGKLERPPTEGSLSTSAHDLH